MRIATLAALFLLSGCASDRIYPKDDGSFYLAITGNKESQAHDKALKDGNAYCHRQSLNFAIIDIKSHYRGASADTKLLTSTLAPRDQFGRPIEIPQGDEDYKVELNFRCK
ncbi:hypothetical protein K2X33_09015 [bacterium]|nr:hypothetical protein [bacterium]